MFFQHPVAWNMVSFVMGLAVSFLGRVSLAYATSAYKGQGLRQAVTLHWQQVESEGTLLMPECFVNGLCLYVLDILMMIACSFLL